MKTKYDWSKAPDNANWIATDEYRNMAWGYINKPIEGSETFYIENKNEWPISIHGIISPYRGYWRDSLEERPKSV